CVGDVMKTVWPQAIVGNIIEEWTKANLGQRQTLVFAPCVKSSIGLAMAFTARGYSAAHIDGMNVWYDGEERRDPTGQYRNEIMDMWDAGEIKVLSNRFVLREGIDRPSIYHLILACPVGSLKTYLQMVGRVIRWSPETADRVLITDHGGSCLKFGSPNMD